MVADIRELLQARPFEPFQIVTGAGSRYRVPSAEHAGVNPRGNRVVIWFDNGGGVTVAALHIAAVEKDSAKKR